MGNNSTKDNPTENKTTNPTKKMKQATKRRQINFMKKENENPIPNLHIETKNKFKNTEQMAIEINSIPTIKKPAQFKQKA